MSKVLHKSLVSHPRSDGCIDMRHSEVAAAVIATATKVTKLNAEQRQSVIRAHSFLKPVLAQTQKARLCEHQMHLLSSAVGLLEILILSNANGKE